MRNFNRLPRSLALVALAMAPLLTSCDKASPEEAVLPESGPVHSSVSFEVSPESVARLLSSLPLSLDQVREVHDGVSASSANGYDEEYPFSHLLSRPGSGLGDESIGSRSPAGYPAPLMNMVSESLPATRAGGFLEELAASGLQIYWPYSDQWDERSLPAITFPPENGAESNIGFLREQLLDGSWVVTELTVDESYAMAHPVWVVGWNDDAGAMTPQMLEKLGIGEVATKSSADFKTLKLKEFKAHRQYDPWWSGGSEFWIKIGSLKAFKADIASDLRLYSPEITDLMIKVKRSQVGKNLRYNTILLSDWSDQLSECAFLITEDDGGKMTSWKANGKVMIKSKSYGFEVEIPYHRNDDIVWRGKLSKAYLDRYNGLACRYGDVSATFTFD